MSGKNCAINCIFYNIWHFTITPNLTTLLSLYLHCLVLSNRLKVLLVIMLLSLHDD